MIFPLRDVKNDPDLTEDPKDIKEIQLVNNINVLTSVELLSSLVPQVCSVILAASRELNLNSDQYLGDEVMFNMLLLSDMLCVPGKLYCLSRRISYCLYST